MKEQDRQELIRYRITRALQTLEEVEVLVENKLWNAAINRLYYACYYAAIALLLSKKVVAQTHSGVRQMLGLHFVKTGLIDKELAAYYSVIFDKRISGDYDDFVEYKLADTQALIPAAKAFIEKARELLEQ
jgi:uncharacterized protein (UPF0332 family)